MDKRGFALKNEIIMTVEAVAGIVIIKTNLKSSLILFAQNGYCNLL